MKVSACGYIVRTIGECSNGAPLYQGGEGSHSEQVYKGPEKKRYGVIDLLCGVDDGCKVFPSWGEVTLLHGTETSTFGNTASTDRHDDVITTGDDTVVRAVSGSYEVAWDGSSTSHAMLRNVALCSATSRRVVYVDSETRRIYEVQPHTDIVEYRIEYPLPLVITAIAPGAQFTLVLASCGIVWSWGMNNHGQLGLGHVTSTHEPTPIDTLGGLVITDIAAGYWHCVAITDCKAVYSWGWNCKGQLGLPKENSMESYPVPLFDEDTDIHAISCGRSHTAFLTDDKYLHVCGFNKYGQCDPQSKKESVFWNNALPSIPLAGNVARVKCGPWSTYYLSEET